MPFKSELVVEEKGRGIWVLKEDLEYQGKYQSFTVPAGTETNFASVPRIFTWLVPTSGEYTKAAVLHDFLWSDPNFPKRDADDIFRRTMRELGVSDLRRWVMWGSVRIGGRLVGARPKDLWKILGLALLVLPFAIPATILVILALLAMYVLEIIIWNVRRALGRRSVKPKSFWWT